MQEIVKSEQGLIGSMIQDPECVDLIRKYVPSGEYFNNMLLGKVFDTVCRLYDEEAKIDLVTVVDSIPKNMGHEIPDFLRNITDYVITTAYAEDYAKIVRDYHARRKLQALLKNIKPMDTGKFKSPNDVLTTLDIGIKEIEGIIQENEEISTFDLVKKCILNVAEMRDGNVNKNIIKTYFHDLDRIIYGIEKTENIILAARPAMGKTALALGIGLNVAKQGKTVIFFSLEMSKERLMGRLLCIEGKIDSKKIKTGKLDDEEVDRLSNAAEVVSRLPIHIYDDAFSILEMRAKIARLEARGEVGLVVIDYLQLIKSKQRFQSRQVELGHYAYEIANLAKKYKTTTLTLSQLNREVEKRANKRPMLPDLYESGAIEAAADKILFLYRDEYYNDRTEDRGIAEVSVPKMRDGETGMCKLAWIGENFRFANLARVKGD